jgi:hypothetical protein
MPLTTIQKLVARLLAANRNPESLGFSKDSDAFHDVAKQVAANAEMDSQVLCNAGFAPNPSAADFAGLQRHYGSYRGAWPKMANANGASGFPRANRENRIGPIHRWYFLPLHHTVRLTFRRESRKGSLQLPA